MTLEGITIIKNSESIVVTSDIGITHTVNNFCELVKAVRDIRQKEQSIYSHEHYKRLIHEGSKRHSGREEDPNARI